MPWRLDTCQTDTWQGGREALGKKKGNPKIRKAYLHSGPNPKERERKENGRVVPF